MTVREIAEKAHEENREFCKQVGDPVKPPWSEMTPGAQQGLIKAVEVVQARLDLSPEENHDMWQADMKEQGYVLGEKIDHTSNPKTHTDLVPYGQLSRVAQEKGRRFREAVRRYSTA